MQTSAGRPTRIRRTFNDLSEEEIANVDRASIPDRMGWSDAFGWEELLKSRRVLIISEAGTGKTYECRAQQARLWDDGEPAFYLDLAQLGRDGLRKLLGKEEEARLDAWLTAQSDIATFFLDSIDELKLTLGSFESALRQLSKALSGQLSRVRIVITTRPIPVDQQLIRKYLPVPDSVELVASDHAFADTATGRRREAGSNKEEKGRPIWRNVALMPLSAEQIREMAVIERVDDPDALLADIRNRDAEDFARRPQDLVELCADWRDFGRIRTHREQVMHNIEIKLKPRSDRREPAQLSPDKALEGASRVALAALLTRKLTIRHSVEADRGGEPGTALDPAVVLHDWTPNERETLLERALFSFASYGRVRFHHRSVMEFLAAHRLKELLSRGMSVKAVKRLLFSETPQKIKIVKPTMRPVAAWLAHSQSSIFAEVRDRQPDVLFDHADPGSLTGHQRASALRAYVQRYGHGGWRGLHVPQVQVHRFASTELADEVQGLWASGIENYEVRELLLELIGAAHMSSCADIAYATALDATAEPSERMEAISALVRLSDARLEAVTRSILEESALWPDNLIRGAIIQLFPNHITVDQLCSMLRLLQASSDNVGDLEWVLPRKIDAIELSPNYLMMLLSGLTDLVTEDLAWEETWPHIVCKRPHLLAALAAVCLRLVKEGQNEADVIRSSVIALRLARANDARDEPVQLLRKALGELPALVRETAFWADDRFVERLHPHEDSLMRLFEVVHYGPLNMNYTQDGAWISKTLSEQGRPLAEREMMLDALMRILSSGEGDRRAFIEGLKLHVADAPELLARIDSQLQPRPVDPKYAKLKAQIEHQSRAAEELKAKHHAEWAAFWREVAKHPQTAFSPDREGNTAWNLWQAMRRSGEDSRASGWNRRFIEHHFSKDVANRLRVSMRSIWRNDRPTLRLEREEKEKDTILIRWQLGLAAVAAEAEDPGWARKLSVEEAELAARYAPIELNGLPTWLVDLAAEHPAAVERTLGPELTAELDEVAGTQSFAILLQNVKYAHPAVARLFVPRLRAWLDENAGRDWEKHGAATALNRLQRVLEILLDHGDVALHAHIRTMAVDQLEAASDGPFTQLWLALLMRLDPTAGTEVLERRLGELEPTADGPAISWFAAMFADGQVDLKRPEFTPALLLRLVRLAYRYVMPSHDVTHLGVYSPGPRDEAQRARNALLTAILDTKGGDGWMAKIEMADDPLFAHFRDRLALLAHEKAAEEMDTVVLNESEVAAIDRFREAPPKTRDEMFALLSDRLDDLDDLLLQDVSPRAAWAKISDEKVMRQQVAREMRNSANHAYTLDQEAVTADEKETDIRLRATTSEQQATIELKIGDDRSGRDLRDAIKNQLVTKYMAAESCRSGCLLVTVAKDRTWKHPDTGEDLDVAGLAAILQAEAAKIVEDMGGSLRLSARILDLRPRLSTERKDGSTQKGGDGNG
jgi:hypothetical protein